MNRDYLEMRAEDDAAEIERLREKVDILRQDVADALKLAQDYKEAMTRLENELQEVRNNIRYDDTDPDLST